MKKHTLTLDDDFEDESPLFDDIAILFFQTDTPGYLFADDLNHLYHLSLARANDLTLLENSWSFYSYHDHLHLLDYYLIGRPSFPSKILILRGEDAMAECDNILHDFNEPPVVTDPLNADLQYRNEILLTYQQVLTPVTSYDPHPPAGLSRKTAKERQELDNLLTDFLDHLDLNHL
jgi:hypothetical protein